MLSQLTRRSAVVAASRLTRTQTFHLARTFIAPTVVRRADFVQELYLKELKSYKPPPVKESDSDGQVLPFSVPRAPKSPEEADLAASLKEYESMAVDVEGQDPADAASPGEAAKVHDWLELDLDEPETKH